MAEPASASVDHNGANHDGSVDNLSATCGQPLIYTSSGPITTQNLFSRGKPFEDLEKEIQGKRQIVFISQNDETDYRNESEAVSYQGVPLVTEFRTPQQDVIQNEARIAEMPGRENGTADMLNVNKLPTTETQNINKLGSGDLSLTFYQQQLMLNHQMMLQQQQTVNSLIGKVDNLSKLVGKKEPTATAVGITPVKRMKSKQDRISHTLSESSEEELNSDSDNTDLESGEYNSDDSGEENRSSLQKEKQVEDNKQVNDRDKDGNEMTGNMKLLKEMAKNFERQEAVGTKVDETLSKVVDSGIRSQIDRTLAKDLCSKYQRPENCQALKVPKINKELWNTSSLIKSSKEQDKAFQTTQKYLNQGLIPLVHLMDNLLKNDDKNFQLASDAFHLLAYAHRDMSNLRRQLIKSVVSEKYRQLCNDSTPLTDNLLGDDLEKQIKTMDEMQKVGKDLTKYKGEKRKYSHKGQDSYEKAKKYQRHTANYSGYKNKDKHDAQSFLYKKTRYHKPGKNNKRNQKQ